MSRPFVSVPIPTSASPAECARNKIVTRHHLPRKLIITIIPARAQAGAQPRVGDERADL
jgi:hypothetical protein